MCQQFLQKGTKRFDILSIAVKFSNKSQIIDIDFVKTFARISITFRRMDESKRPFGYVPEPDLQGIQPLTYEVEQEKKSGGHRSSGRHVRRQRGRGGGRNDAMGFASRNDRFSEHRDSNHNTPRSGNRWSRKLGS